MILAAGIGSRLDPLTRTVPKPMVPVVNRPVIEHIVDKLAAHGFNQITINLHYLGDVIRGHLGDGSRQGVQIEYAQEDQLWGDAGSVKRAERFFEGETFLVVGGDDISSINLTDFLQFHKKNKATASQALSVVDDTSEYGIVLTEADGRITRFQEKPKIGTAFSNTANTGVYLFEPEVFEVIPPGTPWGFGRNVFPDLLGCDRLLYGFITEDYWRDVGNIQVYKTTNFDALAGTVALRISGEQIRDRVWIGSGSTVDPSATIGNNVLIGECVTIQKNAQILDNTIIGDGSRIGSGVVLKESILWRNAIIGDGARLERCIVGEGARIATNFGIFEGLIVDPNKRTG